MNGRKNTFLQLNARQEVLRIENHFHHKKRMHTQSHFVCFNFLSVFFICEWDRRMSTVTTIKPINGSETTTAIKTLFILKSETMQAMLELSWLFYFSTAIHNILCVATRKKEKENTWNKKETVWVVHKCRKAFRLICKIPRCFSIWIQENSVTEKWTIHTHTFKKREEKIK